MRFDEMNAAFDESERVQQLFNHQSGRLAKMLKGRLRSINVRHPWTSEHYALCALKRELANYNMKTGKWKP